MMEKDNSMTHMVLLEELLEETLLVDDLVEVQIM
jgi:hypothetical protein